MRVMILFFILILTEFSFALAPTYDPAAADRALINLTEKAETGAELPILARQFPFRNLWKVWSKPEVISTQIEHASPLQKQKLIFEHYGLLENPKNPDLPLGFVNRHGVIALNCLACHAGQIQGKTLIGLPNRNIDLKSLITDMGRLYPWGDIIFKKLAGAVAPERGLINSLDIEATALLFRNSNMDLSPIPHHFGDFKNSYTNAPPWWNLGDKTHVFADALLPITPRIFITNAAELQQSGTSFRAYENDVADIFELAQSTKAPIFPGEIDFDLAARGKIAFDKVCAKCHGHYDLNHNMIDYPNRIVALDVIKTDPTRARPETNSDLIDFIKNSWIAQGFQSPLSTKTGYLPPPLRGIWATAPYLHNGSVPTLWDLLNPNSRPEIWRVSEVASNYDLVKLGLNYSVVSEIPSEAMAQNVEASRFYDTRKAGLRNDGHDFPEELSLDERHAVLEFLKIL